MGTYTTPSQKSLSISKSIRSGGGIGGSGKPIGQTIIETKKYTTTPSKSFRSIEEKEAQVGLTPEETQAIEQAKREARTQELEDLSARRRAEREAQNQAQIKEQEQIKTTKTEQVSKIQDIYFKTPEQIRIEQATKEAQLERSQPQPQLKPQTQPQPQKRSGISPSLITASATLETPPKKSFKEFFSYIFKKPSKISEVPEYIYKGSPPKRIASLVLDKVSYQHEKFASISQAKSLPYIQRFSAGVGSAVTLPIIESLEAYIDPIGEAVEGVVFQYKIATDGGYRKDFWTSVKNDPGGTFSLVVTPSLLAIKSFKGVKKPTATTSALLTESQKSNMISSGVTTTITRPKNTFTPEGMISAFKNNKKTNKDFTPEGRVDPLTRSATEQIKKDVKRTTSEIIKTTIKTSNKRSPSDIKKPTKGSPSGSKTPDIEKIPPISKYFRDYLEYRYRKKPYKPDLDDNDGGGSSGDDSYEYYRDYSSPDKKESSPSPSTKPPEPRPPQPRPPEPRPPEVKTPQLRSPQLRSPQIRTPQLRTPQLNKNDFKIPQFKIPKPEIRKGSPPIFTRSKPITKTITKYSPSLYAITKQYKKKKTKKKGLSGLEVRPIIGT